VNTFAKEVANWMIGPLKYEMKKREQPPGTFPVPPVCFCRLIQMVHAGAMTRTVAKKVLAGMVSSCKHRM
tara:strand:+ start:647 stop:856 length:210 start_codon:yes stop_codon:yes gene_type:complete